MTRVLPVLTGVILVVIMTLPSPVQATTLSIDGGVIDAIGLATDVIYNFGGGGFNVHGAVLGGCCTLGTFANGVFDIVFHGLLGPTEVTILGPGGGSCVNPSSLLDPPCGRIHLTSTPFDIPLNDPAFNPPFTAIFTTTVPFTATGRLDVGDGFDIVGHGFLQVTFCGNFNLCTVNPGTTAIYTFVAPEPPTLLLACIGLGICAAAAGRRSGGVPRI